MVGRFDAELPVIQVLYQALFADFIFVLLEIIKDALADFGGCGFLVRGSR